MSLICLTCISCRVPCVRRTASRMLVDKHKFLKLPVILGMQQSWLHIPPVSASLASVCRHVAHQTAHIE
jgi:hypothetical protein